MTVTFRSDKHGFIATTGGLDYIRLEVGKEGWDMFAAWQKEGTSGPFVRRYTYSFWDPDLDILLYEARKNQEGVTLDLDMLPKDAPW